MGLVVATIILIVVIASFIAQEPAVFSWAYWQDGGSDTSRSEVVRNLGLLAAGLIGLGVGIWRAVTAYMQAQASQRQAEAANEQSQAAIEQVRVAEQGHITDRFSRAVEQLGSKELPVRLGGIYALWRLIKDSQKHAISVIDILCAFARHPPHETAQGSDPGATKAGPTNKIRADVQTVMDLIGYMQTNYRELLPAEYILGLAGANLSGADLFRANLREAYLCDANLSEANLREANLMRAYLPDTNLTRADLTRAHLAGAVLADAELTDAELTGAELTGAELTGADLTGADLTGADLTGADLTGVHDLTQLQLDSAVCDPDLPAKLPPGLVQPPAPAKPKGENDGPPPER